MTLLATIGFGLAFSQQLDCSLVAGIGYAWAAVCTGELARWIAIGIVTIWESRNV